jgi:acetylcholinesterase
LNAYGDGELTDYIVRFVTNLDPNVGTGKGINWPKYDTSSKKLLTFLDGLVPQSVTADTYRQDGMAYLSELSLSYPL